MAFKMNGGLRKAKRDAIREQKDIYKRRKKYTKKAIKGAKPFASKEVIKGVKNQLKERKAEYKETKRQIRKTY